MAETRQIFEERLTRGLQHNFIVYFLNEDEEQTVNVEESSEVDLERIVQHVNHGGSVFITRRQKPQYAAER